MKIVFHGANAMCFRPGFEPFLDMTVEILTVSGGLSEPGEAEAFMTADVIVGTELGKKHPVPASARLYHVAGAGYDAIDFDRVAHGCPVCNCFGHESAIAEYVMAGLMARNVPLADADARLRKGEWAYQGGRQDTVRSELAGTRIGLLGYGHIGKAVARRAKAFDLEVHVANRSPVPRDGIVDRYWPLSDLDAFYGALDAVVVSLPLSESTAGLVDAAAFTAMRRHCLVINVGRGPVIDERALYEALKSRTIEAAIIDAWYVYPASGNSHPHPGNMPFHELDNITLTPHMSGWTTGTIRRRQRTIAENIRRLAAREPLRNVVNTASLPSGR